MIDNQKILLTKNFTTSFLSAFINYYYFILPCIKAPISNGCESINMHDAN